jgi:hypothetical protein
MKLDNYKLIKKSQWQELAKAFDVEFDENSVVRYLVEKIAEKIGVDDKIVSDNDLKKKVVEKINIDYEIVPDIDDEEKTILEETIEEKVEELVVKSEEIIEESKLSEIDELRLECQNYGVAWSEIHTIQNLQEILSAVKKAGATKVGNATSLDSPISQNNIIDTTKSFEITSENVEVINKSISTMPNLMQEISANITNKEVVNGGYKSSGTYLENYKNIYLNAIRGHFRLLTVNEINEMINRDKQTFNFAINYHPNQNNKIEIILTQGNDSVRIPSNNENEWIDING